MNRIEDIGIIVFPSLRSRAYLDQILRSKISLKYAVLVNLEFSPPDMPNNLAIEYFDFEKKEEEYLNELGINYTSVQASNINDSTIFSLVQDSDVEYFIYTGGGIVESLLLDSISLIHIHPGNVPQYRGSTCFYYSILEKGTIGTTAFVMDKNLDTGPVIIQNEYKPVTGVDIDFILDNYYRSLTLVDTLKLYIKDQCFRLKEQLVSDGNTYYVIHPLLKHISILSLNV